jgi:hypothetical protein
MRVRQGTATLTATDLANHLSCRHLTTLDLRLAKGEIAEPSWENPHLLVLQQRGLEHEKTYIESLRSKGLAIVDLSNEAEEMASEATWATMKSGAQAIVQASLGSGDWRGRADVLLRVDQIEKPSRLGNWSYELVDCKLARQTKAETILQLCLYSELVTELQGLEPEFFHVIRPNVGFQPAGLDQIRCKIRSPAGNPAQLYSIYIGSNARPGQIRDHSSKVLTLRGWSEFVSEPGSQSEISARGAFAGTPESASPEQFAGVGVDIRSDLYSLGAVLWEMLTAMWCSGVPHLRSCTSTSTHRCH